MSLAKQLFCTKEFVRKLTPYRQAPKAVFGTPKTTYRDKGSHFTRLWFRIVCQVIGLRHASTVAYKGPSDGCAEVAGRQLFKQSKKLRVERPGLNWQSSMWRAIQAYHDLPTLSRYSRHQILFGSDQIKQGLPWVNYGDPAQDLTLGRPLFALSLSIYCPFCLKEKDSLPA